MTLRGYGSTNTRLPSGLTVGLITGILLSHASVTSLWIHVRRMSYAPPNVSRSSTRWQCCHLNSFESSMLTLWKYGFKLVVSHFAEQRYFLGHRSTTVKQKSVSLCYLRQIEHSALSMSLFFQYIEGSEVDELLFQAKHNISRHRHPLLDRCREAIYDEARMDCQLHVGSLQGNQVPLPLQGTIPDYG